MKTATTHYAKTHLSKLLKDAQSGEKIVILNGKTPVAELNGVSNKNPRRPKLGTITSEPVDWNEETFAPLNDQELQDWGL